MGFSLLGWIITASGSKTISKNWINTGSLSFQYG